MDKKQRQWSYSSISCFAHCKYEFYLNYIIADDNLYLSEGNYWAEAGGFVHEILAMVFSGELDVNDAIDYFVDHYDERVCYKTWQSMMDKTYEQIVDYFANLDISWIKNYEILGVEFIV